MHLKRISGWGAFGDDEAPYNDTDTEDSYYKDHPASEPFRRKLPLNYEQLLELYGNHLATGDLVEDPEDLAEDSEDDIAAVSDQDKEDNEDGSDEEEDGDSGSEGSPSVASRSSSRGRGRGRGRGGSGGSVREVSLARQAASNSARTQAQAAAGRQHVKQPIEAIGIDFKPMTRSLDRYSHTRSKVAAPIVTQAVVRVTGFEPLKAKALDPAIRYQLIKLIAQEEHRDIIIGLPDPDLESYLLVLVESLTTPRQPSPQPQQPQPQYQHQPRYYQPIEPPSYSQPDNRYAGVPLRPLQGDYGSQSSQWSQPYD